MHLNFRSLVLAGLALIVSSLVSGYFFTMGVELWQLSKENFPTAIILNLIYLMLNPIWIISLPIGILGVALILRARYMNHVAERRNVIVVGRNFKFAFLTTFTMTVVTFLLVVAATLLRLGGATIDISWRAFSVYLAFLIALPAGKVL